MTSDKSGSDLINIDPNNLMIEKASTCLKIYPLTIILILGLFGNGLIFYVFLCRPNFRNSTIARYVKLLVVMDTSVLLCGTLQNIHLGVSKKDLAATSTAGCVIFRFVMFFTGDIAIWTLLVMTIDRFIAVVVPTKNQVWKSQKYTIMVESSLFILSLIKNFPIFFTFQLTETVNKTSCEPRDSMLYYERKIRPGISLIVYYLIPVFTVTVLTALILKQMSIVSNKLSVVSSRSNNSQQHTYSKSLTRMCFAINILFFLLITPSIIIWTLIAYGGSSINKNFVLLFFDITNVLVFCHHSLNFYLFFLTGPRFRREVLSIICPHKYDIHANHSTECSHKANAPVNSIYQIKNRNSALENGSDNKVKEPTYVSQSPNLNETSFVSGDAVVKKQTTFYEEE